MNEYEIKQLILNLAYFTECNLATYEQLKNIKSTSKYALRRQGNICFKMLCECRKHKAMLMENKRNIIRVVEIVGEEEFSKGLEKFGLVYGD